MILFSTNIIGSAAMRLWEERLRGASIAPLHAPTRPNARKWNTSRESRSGGCVTRARSSGAASCSTSRKSWLKRPWDSNPSTMKGGNCVTVFSDSVYSMTEPKPLARLQLGMELNEHRRRTGYGNRGKTKDVFPPFPQPLLLSDLNQKCKPCPRSET